MPEQLVGNDSLLRVNRGDLITADWMNALLTRLSNLESAVQQLSDTMSNMGTKPEGKLYVSLKKSPEVDTLAEGQSYIFVFNIKAVVRVAETYVLEAKIEAQKNQSGWQVSTIPSVFLSAPEDLMVGSNKEVSLVVWIPEGTAQSSALLTLSAHALHNEDGLRDENSIVLLVGGQPPAAENISIDRKPTQFSGCSYDEQADSIRLNRNDTNMTYNAVFTSPDTYDVKVETVPAGTTWQAYLLSSRYPQTTQANESHSIKVNVIGAAGLTPATLKITIKPTTLNFDPYVFTQKVQMA